MLQFPRTETSDVQACRLLFVEDEDFLFAGKTNFLHLSVSPHDDRGVLGLGVALFPAAFADGHGALAFLNGGFIAIDGEQIFAGLNGCRTEFCGL